MGFIETAYSGNPTLKDLDINADLDLKGEYDAKGIKRLICEDYFGSIKATASSNTQWTLTLDDVSYGDNTKKFRVPSNFVASEINLVTYFTNTDLASRYVYLKKYDPNTETYTTISTKSIGGNTTTPTGAGFYNISVNAGDILCFTPGYNTITVYGSMGVNVNCDITAVLNGYWEIED